MSHSVYPYALVQETCVLMIKYICPYLKIHMSLSQNAYVMSLS